AFGGRVLERARGMIVSHGSTTAFDPSRIAAPTPPAASPVEAPVVAMPVVTTPPVAMPAKPAPPVRPPDVKVERRSSPATAAAFPTFRPEPRSTNPSPMPAPPDERRLFEDRQ